MMATIRRTFMVNKPVGEVVGFLRDFSHAAQWDPGTETCTRVDSGPVREGSSWHNVSRFLGRRVEVSYRLASAAPNHLTFVGTNDSAATSDDLTFEAVGAATRITYRAKIRLRGAAGTIADPVVQLALLRLAHKTTVQMREVINGL